MRRREEEREEEGNIGCVRKEVHFKGRKKEKEVPDERGYRKR